MGARFWPLLAVFLSLGLLFDLGGPHAAARQDVPLYLALGDSIAFGVGATDPPNMGYVGLTFDSLRRSEQYRVNGLELVNLAVPGATSADLLLPGGQLASALQEIDARRRQSASPESAIPLISIDVGGNDLLNLASADSGCLDDPAGQACLQRFEEVLRNLQANLTEVLDSLRAAAPDAEIIVVDLYNPFSGTGDQLEPIAEVGVGQLNGVIGAVAAAPELRVKVASVFALFRNRGDEWIAADGLHPNDSGHAIITEALLATMEGRAPDIPEDLAGPQDGGQDAGSGASGRSEDQSDGVSLLFLAIALAISFAAGGLVVGAYFMARGRA